MVTFVLRVHRRSHDADGEEEPRGDARDEEIRGLVEHVASGRRVVFRAVDELVAFLKSMQG